MIVIFFILDFAHAEMKALRQTELGDRISGSAKTFCFNIISIVVIIFELSFPLNDTYMITITINGTIHHEVFGLIVCFFAKLIVLFSFSGSRRNVPLKFKDQTRVISNITLHFHVICS